MRLKKTAILSSAIGSSYSADSIFLKRKGLKTRFDIRFPAQFPAKGVMPAAGLEPARCCHQWILSPPRLPFRQAGVTITVLIILSQDFPFGKCFL